MNPEQVVSYNTEATEILNREEMKVPRQSDRMNTKIRNLRKRADTLWLYTHIRDPRGGLRTVEVASQLHDELQKRIDREISEGHDQHNRLPWFAKKFASAAVFIDFFILLYFMTSVFNVDFNNLASIPMVVSIIFAILATGISYAVFTACGARLRDCKTTQNTIKVSNIDGITWLVLAGTLLLITAISVLMYFRVSSEVFEALGPGRESDAMMYAGVFAVMVVCLALIVVFVHAFDGSSLTERVEGLARAIKKPMKKRRKYLDQAQELEHLIKEQQEIAARQVR